MIKYNLICKCGQTFESWFSTSTEYDALKRKKLIRCIYCNAASVEKTVMAPNLSSKSNKITDKIKSERKIKKQLIELRKYIEKFITYHASFDNLDELLLDKMKYWELGET